MNAFPMMRPMGSTVRWCWIVAGIGLAAFAWAHRPVALVPQADAAAFAFWVLASASCLTGLAGAFGRRAGLLTGFLALTTGARLLLVQPLWLQSFHVSPWALRQGLAPIAVLVILVQAALVGRYVRGRCGRWFATLRPLILSWRGLAALIILLGASAHVSLLVAAREAPDFPRRSIEFASQIPLVALLVLLDLGHLAWIGGVLDTSALDRWRARWGARIHLPQVDVVAMETPRAWDRGLPYLLAVAVLGVSASLAYFTLDAMPHIPDGVAYLFQAECLAGGEVAAPAPPVPDAHRMYLIDVREGRRFAVTNPGWPLVLALGVLLGAPWLVNPVLGAVCVLLLHALARRRLGWGMAHVLTVLMAASPWFLFLSASFMTHVVTLAAILAAALLLERGGRGRSFLAGCAAGFVFLVRPLDALLAGGFLGVLLLARGGPGRLARAAAFAGGSALVGSLLFVFNRLLTGEFFRFAINDYLLREWPGSTNRLGFGANVGNPPGGWGILDPLPGHGWKDVLLNLNQNLYNLNFELFGFSCGSLLPVLLALVFVKRRADLRWAWGYVVLIAAGMSLYWFSGGPDFGPRYWFLMLPALIWLAAEGIAGFGRWLGDGTDVGRGPSVMILLGGFLLCIALGVFLPWRTTMRYRNYRGFHPGYRRLVRTGGFGRAIVEVVTRSEGDYASAFLLNPPDVPDDGPLFVRPGFEEALRRAYPDRPYLRVRGPSVTGAGVQPADD